MNQYIRRKTSAREISEMDEVLPEVESYLESKFRPIAPRPDFVSGLKTRLADPANVKRSPRSNLYFVVLVVAAMAVTSLLVAGVVRLLVLLVESLRIVNLFNRQVEEKQNTLA
jgi:hypothetical protein